MENISFLVSDESIILFIIILNSLLLLEESVGLMPYTLLIILTVLVSRNGAGDLYAEHITAEAA